MKCRFKSYVAIVRNVTEQQCQEQCKRLGQTKCQATLYNSVAHLCQMVNITMNEYLDTCNKIGGPKVCNRSDEQCVRLPKSQFKNPLEYLYLVVRSRIYSVLF